MHRSMNVKSPNNTSKWQMGFNSAFEGLKLCVCVFVYVCMCALFSGGVLCGSLLQRALCLEGSQRTFVNMRMNF
jgi:hypothetical protein